MADTTPDFLDAVANGCLVPARADEARTGRWVSENSCFLKVGLTEACGLIRFWIALISGHLAWLPEGRLVGQSWLTPSRASVSAHGY